MLKLERDLTLLLQHHHPAARPWVRVRDEQLIVSWFEGPVAGDLRALVAEHWLGPIYCRRRVGPALRAHALALFAAQYAQPYAADLWLPVSVVEDNELAPADEWLPASALLEDQLAHLPGVAAAPDPAAVTRFLAELEADQALVDVRWLDGFGAHGRFHALVFHAQVLVLAPADAPGAELREVVVDDLLCTHAMVDANTLVQLSWDGREVCRIQRLAV